ncbi:MAG: hypothetical protein JWP91_2985 [Fibrobacteres bacterium]|nr:hypothetical protein [Fibrobacterota bacterium]
MRKRLCKSEIGNCKLQIGRQGPAPFGPGKRFEPKERAISRFSNSNFRFPICKNPSSADRLQAQRGATLAVVLGIGLVLGLTLFLVAGRSGRSRVDTVKTMKATQEFYLADAGFNYIKTRVTELNRQGGAKLVRQFLGTQSGLGWQRIGFGSTEMGSFRLQTFQVTDVPLSIELNVQGVKDPTKPRSRYESVQGVLRVPSLAKYARYVEGPSTLVYTGGTLVDGEILVAGDIDLTSPTVTFTRLVSTGGGIQNRPAGQYDFGFREKQTDIPTLNHVHINSWDNYLYDNSKYSSTFQYMARNGGIELFGNDAGPKNPSWSRLNGGPGGCHTTGPCDTLFLGCYDTLSRTRRSPVVVAGSAVAIDLSQIVINGGNIEVTVSPVVYDAGGDGLDWFVLGTPARKYVRKLSDFKDNAILYFPGDIYVTGKLKQIPITIAAGDDIFLYGDFIGPEKTEVDANNLPVTLGLIAQDRVYVHESSSRDLTIRAAILAENDEIVYDDRVDGGGSDPDWKYGYVCRREVFDPANVPAPGSTVDFSKYISDNYIWDDGRVAQSGFGREPEEECRKDGTCPNIILEEYGFAVLAFPRTKGARWKLTFEGSLITRNYGSKGPKDQCSLGWDCNGDPTRVSWSYDDNLGVAYPPKFPAPVVDDRNPSQIVGYKRKSF